MGNNGESSTPGPEWMPYSLCTERRSHHIWDWVNWGQSASDKEGEVSMGNTATHLTNCSHAYLTTYLHIYQSWLHCQEAYNQWKRSFASMEMGWSARIQGPPYVWQASEVYGISSKSWSCIYHKPIYQVFQVWHKAPDPTGNDLSIPPCNNKAHASAAQVLSSRLKYKDNFWVVSGLETLSLGTQHNTSALVNSTAVIVMQWWPQSYRGESGRVKTPLCLLYQSVCTCSQSATWGSVPQGAL